MTAGADGPRSGRIVGILLCVVPLSQIPLDIYTPAMPDMVTDLSSTSTAVQASVTAYMLGLAVGFIPVGVLADTWGRKRVLTVCIGVVIVASLGCATATAVPMLLGARFVQGLGACACMVLSYAVAADCFRGKKLTSVAGLLGAAWGLAPVIAPAVGGVLTQFLTWRLIFVLIAAMTLLLGVVVVMALPETLSPADRVPVDVRATSRTSVTIVTHPVFACFVVVFGLMAAAQLAFGVAGPFLYQSTLGFTPAAYGLIALCVGAVSSARRCTASPWACSPGISAWSVGSPPRRRISSSRWPSPWWACSPRRHRPRWVGSTPVVGSPESCSSRGRHLAGDGPINRPLRAFRQRLTHNVFPATSAATQRTHLP
ncbi:MFS transporter [Gordonia sp. 'Campus']|uniref:MFS transporter n=1 Tax=Gordonia sp. 'Campus' TaxID=2915824 RepID=UPI001EE4428F|nr:MFS transporter [Gordonia sp. 'Campus']